MVKYSAWFLLTSLVSLEWNWQQRFNWIFHNNLNQVWGRKLKLHMNYLKTCIDKMSETSIRIKISKIMVKILTTHSTASLELSQGLIFKKKQKFGSWAVLGTICKTRQEGNTGGVPVTSTQAMLLALDAILGHRSAHSLATGPLIADPFISPLLFTITPALSSK